MIPTAIETVAEIRFWPSRALGSSAPIAPAPNPSASSTRIDGSRSTWAISGAAAARTTTSPSSNRVRDWLSAATTTNLPQTPVSAAMSPALTALARVA